MSSARTSFVTSDLAAALIVGVLGGLAMLMISDVQLKYQLAAIVGLATFAALTTFQERRIACVVMWIVVHPLGIEKVFFLDGAEGPMFTDPTLNINISDAPLVMLTLFLAAEMLISGRSAIRWSRLSTVLLAYLAWSVVSFLIHAIYLRDGLTTSSPILLGQDVRLLVFVTLIQSAVRTRADVITALATMAAAIAAQSGFVMLSYLTNHVYTYAAAASAAGADATLQGFSSSGSAQLSRATGTVGHTNEQAMFHAFTTIPLIALFVSRSAMVRLLALAIVAASALALLLTFSRGAWLSFPLGIGVCGLLIYRRHGLSHSVALAGGLLTLTGAVALIFLAQPIYQRLAYGDTGASASRLRQIELGLDIFRLYPVTGAGPGEFAQAALLNYPYESHPLEKLVPGQVLPYPSPNLGRLDVEDVRIGSFHLRRPLPVHNKYVLTLAELGLPGLLIWLWLYVEFLRTALRTSRRSDRLLETLGIAGVGVAVAQLAYMMVDLFAEDKPLEIMLFLPALIFAAANCMETRISVERPTAYRPYFSA